MVTNQEVRRVAHDIVQYIINALHVLPGCLSKKNVMQKVMANLKALDFIPKSTSKQASLIVVWNEIISGLKESLGAMKNLYTFAKLVIKHALLIISISFVDNFSLLRQKACILGVHHHNVSLTMCNAISILIPMGFSHELRH